MAIADEVQGALQGYFAAEKGESLFFMGVGLAALVATALLWKTGSDYRGMGYPLVAIGLIQIAVGGGVFFRTDRQVTALTEKLRAAPAALEAEEVARMEPVMRNFRIYKTVEIATIAGGIALTFLFRDRAALY